LTAPRVTFVTVPLSTLRALSFMVVTPDLCNLKNFSNQSTQSNSR
jgi:hypothetical protein